MNYLSQEKDTLSNFLNLLQSGNYQEARSLLEWKQEAFQSLSKTFVQSVKLMQQLPEDDFATRLVPEEFGDEVFAVETSGKLVEIVCLTQHLFLCMEMNPCLFYYDFSLLVYCSSKPIITWSIQCLKKLLLTLDILRILYFQWHFNVKQKKHFP